MRRFWTTAKLVLLVLIAVVFFVAPFNQAQDTDPRYTYRFGCPAEEEYNYCPERYDSLQSDKDTYRKGETVTLTLSYLRDFEYYVEKVEVYLEPMFEYGLDLVYVEEEVGPIPQENDEWTWTWDQKDNSGEQVDAGRLYARITLNCCKNYRDYFKIERRGGTGDLFQVSEPEEVEEEVTIPSSPSGLRVEDASPREITITWADNSDDEDGFRIYRNGSRIATVDPDVTSYTDTGLDPGKDYSYQVAAYNTAGESGMSAQLTSTTGQELPSSPSGLRVEDASPREITITWADNSDDEDGFRIYRNGSRIATVDPDVTSYTDTGLDPGKDYSYQVAAYNTAGESGMSAQLTSTTGQELPSSPSGLRVEDASPREITITWADNSDDEDGFRIYRNGSRIATVDPDVTSYTDTGLDPGKDYSYQVAAYNSAGESSMSARLSSATKMEIPSSPSGLTTEATSPTEITLSWQDNSDNEDGFRIYRNGTRVATVGPNVTTYTHKNLNSETRYCYEVVSYNESGESETSNRNCAVTKVAIPEVPGNVRANALSPSQITISWGDNSDNEEGFRIYRDGSRIATVGPNVTSYTDTGLEAGKSYSYAVTAFNNSGESGIASTVNMRTMEVEKEPEREEPKEEPGITQAQLLAGIGVVLMVMGYIYTLEQ